MTDLIPDSEPHDALLIVRSLGPAELTVVAVELGIELVPVHIGQHDAIRGDRAIVRNHPHRPGLCDIYAVFKREQRSRFWRQVTDELTVDQLPGWRDTRNPSSATMSPRFDRWLARVAETYR